MQRRAFLSGSLAVLAGCRPNRGAGFAGYAFVANHDGQAVAAVDLTAFTVARHIRLEGSPTAVLAHPRRPAILALCAAEGTLHEIDAGRLQFRRKATVAQRAVSMLWSPDSSHLWTLCAAPRLLARVAAESLQADLRIPLPAEPLDFDVSSDGRLVAVSFAQTRAVTVFDSTGAWHRNVPLERPAANVRFRSNSEHLLITHQDDRLLTIADVESGRLVTQLPLAMRPENLCFKSDGGQLFITGSGMDAVAVVYPYRTEVAETALAGSQPGSMAACSTPEVDYLFVANPPSGDVTVLDIPTRKVVAVIAVGREPSFIVITPDGEYALVLNRGSGDMAVIYIKAIRSNRSKLASMFTLIPVGSKPVSAVVRAVG